MSDNSARRSWALLTIGVLFVVSAMIGATRSAHSDTPNYPPRALWMRTLCPQEDSSDCAWNANVQGNGQGHSFYSTIRELKGNHGENLGRVECIYYVKTLDANRWDQCFMVTPTPTNLHRPLLWWQKRSCRHTNGMNCYVPRGDSITSPHPSYVRYFHQTGMVCQFYLGKRRFANRHDYCN